MWDLQDRRGRPGVTRPWVVRWKIDGSERSRAYATRAEADHVRSRLLVAHRDGETFDIASGWPVSWLDPVGERRLYEWVREWLAEQWPEWAPRTRRTAVEALSRFVPLVHADGVRPAPPGARVYLIGALSPDAVIDENHPVERWLARWSPLLSDLDREMLARAERALGVGIRKQRLAASVWARYRKLAHGVIVRAVDLGLLETDPWPPPTRGRSSRKATRTRRSVDVRVLPSPSTMTAVLGAIPTHQPGSHMYAAMTAVAYFAGLRPSEVVMLRRRSLTLPSEGWGRIDVTEAEIDWDEPGEPKTGCRSVPIPPVLVERLRRWTEDHDIGDSGLLFRTRNDRRPTPSNWSRALRRACRAVGTRELRVYDCRHAAATTWLQAGVPLGVVARRLGHSVETLVSTYVGAIDDDEEHANRRVEALLSAS